MDDKQYNETPINYPTAFGHYEGSISTFAPLFAIDLMLKKGIYVDNEVIDILDTRLKQLSRDARESGERYAAENPY